MKSFRAVKNDFIYIIIPLHKIEIKITKKNSNISLNKNQQMCGKLNIKLPNIRGSLYVYYKSSQLLSV